METIKKAIRTADRKINTWIETRKERKREVQENIMRLAELGIIVE